MVLIELHSPAYNIRESHVHEEVRMRTHPPLGRLAAGALRLPVALALILACAGTSKAAELKLAVENEISSLDPHFHNFIPNVEMNENLYNALTTLDENQNVVPALA